MQYLVYPGAKIDNRISERMKISVIIPCFNERGTIEQVVDAVRAAPIENIEIVIVDDGSTDGTIDVLKEKVA